MPQYQFHEQPYAPLCEATYVQVATDFISDVAPSLHENLKRTLAERATAAMFDGERESVSMFGYERASIHALTETVMNDPLLMMHRHRECPEVNAACPHSILGDYPSYLSCHIWESDQQFAKSGANRLENELNQVNISAWLDHEPMTQIRVWRDKLLPDRPKRGQKWELLRDLKRHPDFPAEAKKGYAQWRQELRCEIDRLLAKAAEEPRATHLQWLAWLVLVHLDNYHTATNSTEGPEAFAATCQRLQAAAQTSPPPLDEDALNEELEKTFHFLGTRLPPEYSPIELAKGYIAKMRNCLSTDAIAAELAQYAPGKVVVTKLCTACEQQTSARHAKATKGKLAPYHVLCLCTGYRWLPKHFNWPVHKWDFGKKVDRDATIWALDRLLGINQAPLNFLALATRASIQETTERIERDVEIKMAAYRSVQKKPRGRPTPEQPRAT